MFRLDGKKAVITGGSKGLGKVIATALAQAGADVALASRSLEECQSAASEISKQTGRKAIPIAADVVKNSDVLRMISEAEKNLGPIDILINNAGTNIRGNAQDLSESDWDTVVDVNLKAPFLISQKLGPKMCDRGWGRIINMGSIMS